MAPPAELTSEPAPSTLTPTLLLVPEPPVPSTATAPATAALSAPPRTPLVLQTAVLAPPPAAAPAGDLDGSAHGADLRVGAFEQHPDVAVLPEAARALDGDGPRRRNHLTAVAQVNAEV